MRRTAYEEEQISGNDCKEMQENRITEIRFAQNSAKSQVAMLAINGSWRRCMVDTGAAVTLIQKRWVPEDMIEPEGARELGLTGITGHSITTYGTTTVEVGLDLEKTLEVMEMIVCDDDVLDNTDLLLGRDFLEKLKATLDYAEQPTLYLWGEKATLWTSEDEREPEEDTIGKAISRLLPRETTLEDWLSQVKIFLETGEIVEQGKSLWQEESSVEEGVGLIETVTME